MEGGGSIVAVVLSAIVLLAVALVSHARSRTEARAHSARLGCVLRRVARLSAALRAVRREVDEGLEGAGKEAQSSSAALGGALRARAGEAQEALGDTDAALAELASLLQESGDGARELLQSLAREERGERDRQADVAGARHVEVVSHLSDGGLGRVVDALLDAGRKDAAAELAAIEGFSPGSGAHGLVSGEAVKSSLRKRLAAKLR